MDADWQRKMNESIRKMAKFLFFNVETNNGRKNFFGVEKIGKIK